MDSLETKQVFGNYLMKRKLGTGGMATVYHAAHAKTGEEVALKILHEHYADDELVRRRFSAEAQIVMSLQHPNIVPITDSGQVGTRPYLVMQYMEGGSLAGFFSKPREISHQATLRLLKNIASGLDYAHAQGVIHRDLKLENILLNRNLPAISDFGIAQSARTTRITMTGQILGTPQYLAPETLDDTPVDYRVDLYAMAVMAYLMLTGYFPFTGKDPLNTLIKHRTEIVPLPSTVNPQLPAMLDAVLLRGLSKSPDDRYPSAASFVEALENAYQASSTVTTMIFLNQPNPVKATQTDLGKLLATPDFSNPSETRILPESVEKIPAALPEEVEKEEVAKPKRKTNPALVGMLMLFICALSFGAILFFNGGSNFNLSGFIAPEASEEITAEATELVEATEEFDSASSLVQDEETEETASNIASDSSVTTTASPTRRISNTATNTSQPTNTSRPSNTPTTRPSSTPTSRPSNTARPLPTDTARPLPTDTPRPLPTNTQVPPTNPPAPTSVPPTNPPAPTSVPPTNPPAPTNTPQGILDPILDPVNTLVPCIPLVTC